MSPDNQIMECENWLKKENKMYFKRIAALLLTYVKSMCIKQKMIQLSQVGIKYGTEQLFLDLVHEGLHGVIQSIHEASEMDG